MGTDGAPEGAAEASSATALVVVGAPARPAKLSDELARILQEFKIEIVTLRDVIAVLQDRAYDLLLLLLALPFLLPIPLLGLSTPFGAVIAVIAARLLVGKPPWLPRRLLDTKLPPKFFPLVLGTARRIIRVFELLLKPRLLWLTSGRLPQAHALVILLAALLLLLPLPPGTNFPPALCIVVMSAGLLERDGVFVLGGYLAFLGNIVFFALFAFYGTKLFEMIWAWTTQWFGG